MSKEKVHFCADDVERVVEQRDQALHRLEHPDHDHHDRGEQRQPDCELVRRRSRTMGPRDLDIAHHGTPFRSRLCTQEES